MLRKLKVLPRFIIGGNSLNIISYADVTKETTKISTEFIKVKKMKRLNVNSKSDRIYS